MPAPHESRSAPTGGGEVPSQLLLLCDPSPERDRLEESLRLLGAPLRMAPLLGGGGPPGLVPGPGELVLVGSLDLEGLIAGCARVRADAPEAALLACLLTPPPVDSGQAAAHALGAGADDLLLGVPPDGVILSRVIAATRVARGRQRAGRSAALHRALRQIIDLIGAASVPRAREGSQGGYLDGRGLSSGEAEGPRASLETVASRPERRASDGPDPGRQGEGGGSGREHGSDDRRGAAGTKPGPEGSSDDAQRVSGHAPSDGVPIAEAPDSRAALRAFHQVLAIAASAVGWDHAALCVGGDDEGLLLLATSADGERGMVPLRAAEHPSLLQALRGGERTSLTGAPERGRLSQTTLLPEEGVLLALPLRGDVPGAERLGAFLLLLQSAAPGARLDAEAREFLCTAAQVTALALRGPTLGGALRDQTRRINLGRYAAERRREALSHYREFFESTADGVLVLDDQGRVQYLNRVAAQLTGYAPEGLGGRSILELVPETQRKGLLDAVGQVLRQVTLHPFDLQLTTTSRETLVLSVSCSSALSHSGLALLSFRDVTEQRILEHELRKTKDFLERLIDSTVDGIIAADLYGEVLLFNQGAARLTGYSPDEVIRKIPVWRLYPDGEARDIMAQLRAGGHGGVGRLQGSRRTILGKGGVKVPVSLTAAIVYEEGREVATVGVISDLRERLHIEERLQKTQEKLAASEKQALIAELAGAAAHELNQPLTSVMGYAGLLRRKLGQAPELRELVDFVDIVVRESERMAEIVRKIGRITRYETKPYVGEVRILDLDKSTDPPTPAYGVSVAARGRKEG